jgi:hypothetical protein
LFCLTLGVDVSKAKLDFGSSNATAGKFLGRFVGNTFN